MQGHHSAKPHTSCQVPLCHMHACCSCSCELVDTHALSTHRSRVLVRRQFSLPAYTRVTNFCHIFGRRNGGRLIRGRAYTRVYTVSINCVFRWIRSHSVRCRSSRRQYGLPSRQYSHRLWAASPYQEHRPPNRHNAC